MQWADFHEVKSASIRIYRTKRKRTNRKLIFENESRFRRFTSEYLVGTGQ